MKITSLTIAHIAIFYKDELVSEGLRIAARKAFSEGNVKKAAELLECEAKDIERLLGLMASALPDAKGPTVWSAQEVHTRSRKQIEMEIQRALFGAMATLGSTHEIAAFYKTSASTVQRALRAKSEAYAGPGTGESGCGL